jgi:cyclic-di-AMP phosphodiesterase PgpH
MPGGCLMFFVKEKNNTHKNIKRYITNKTVHRVLVGIITLIVSLVIIINGATPEKFKLNINDVSKYNINATREIEDKSVTLKNAQNASAAIPAAMIEIKGVSIDVINTADTFVTYIENYRKSVEKSLSDQAITIKSKNYKKQLAIEQEVAAGSLFRTIKELKVPLSIEQVRFLIIKASEADILSFKEITRNLISTVMKQDITEDNLEKEIYSVQNSYQSSELNQDLKIIGGLLAKAILKENKEVDDKITEAKRSKAFKDAMVDKKFVIKKDDRIISIGDTVTKEKYELLKTLNLLEDSTFDFALAGGILVVLSLLAIMLILFMNHFCKKILYSRNDIILLSVIILLSILIARWMNEYSSLAIPIFIATLLISILLDLKLAIIVNFVLTIAISLITKGDLLFIYMSMISGTFAAFFVSKAHQRSRLLMTGVVIAAINVTLIVSYGIINKTDVSVILTNSEIVFINGIISIVITLGSLPFWESVFNIISPLKLLELANPNQPLIKRLLMEAPGTYHHSLMVGNLAEVATDAIGGNSLLARVGAYYHDVGKLKRPNFFKENQLSDNPHDRMTANLSTLVITSHTRDGVELAEKFKIPLAIREIVNQHHGNTLVAYFFHKAKKGEKGEEVKQENFRYEGPKPTTKESAVVLLADSVEAAVRSMIDKTEGKIEGLVRKIIKDKLDDGQLDQCNLTLKDLDDIAKGFIKVFSGYFHEREEYPEMKQKNKDKDEINANETLELKDQLVEGEITNDSIN